MVTNNYALDPIYRLGYVQIWNLDIQRQLPGNVQLEYRLQRSQGNAPGYAARADSDVFDDGTAELRNERGFRSVYL